MSPVDLDNFAVIAVAEEVFAATVIVSGLYPIFVKLTTCDLLVARILARLPVPDKWETIVEKPLPAAWNLTILYTSTFVCDAMEAT
jgi:hypothetical protein